MTTRCTSLRSARPPTRRNLSVSVSEGVEVSRPQAIAWSPKEWTTTGADPSPRPAARWTAHDEHVLAYPALNLVVDPVSRWVL